jgi:hypothetical protein
LPSPSLSEIYDGARKLGEIHARRGGAFAAFGVDDRRLGAFSNVKDAMRAVCGAARSPHKARS